MIFSLSFLWFIREVKAILFWLYLWQLKEYHIGRFVDHFRTEKGRQLIFNPLNVLKIVLILSFFSLPLLLFFSIFFVYTFESIKTLLDFLTKRLKEPIFTKKTVFLISAGLLLEIIFLLIIFLNIENIVLFAFWLVVFDVLTSLIVSAVVLFFQPLAVLAKTQLIKKAKLKRDLFKNLLVVGITGSYGKTSTKEFLAAILSEEAARWGGAGGASKVLKTKEHQNSEVGISQCILNDLRPEHEIFIVEMGAYNRGGIKLLCDIVKPKIGILTGINEQHMATFGSLENIIRAKYELIESLPKDGIAFFNAKNKYCAELYEKTLRRGSGRAFLYGQNARFFGGENILGAMAVAREIGMTEDEIQRAVSKIENKMPGIQIKEGIGGLKIIDATYSANPNGVIAHLDYLKNWSGRKIIVMPCLIELGKASKEVHKKIGQKIAEVCDLAIITTKDRFKEIKETAGEKAVFMESPNDIYKKIRNFCLSSEALAKEGKDGCTVLLESRVPSQLISFLIKK